LMTVPSSSVLNYESQLFPGVDTQDTLNFLIKRNPELDETGASLFEIFIDPQNETEEILEDNNSVSLTLEIFTGTTSNLYPLDFGIVSATNVDLVYQLSDLTTSRSRPILLEIDTTATFDSPWKRNNLIETDLLGTWSLDINFNELADGQVFYWRTKLQNPGPTEQDGWVTSSFSYIAGSPAGWRQASEAQLQETLKEGVFLDTSKQWNFETESTSVTIATHGADNEDLQKEDVQILISGANILDQNMGDILPCAENTMNVIVFDRRSAFPYAPIFVEGDDGIQRIVCGRKPQFVYNLLEKDITGFDEDNAPVPTMLDSLINESALGDVVLLFNIKRVNFSVWPDGILDKLGEIGVAGADVRALEDGQPVIIIGKKGSAPGSAQIIDNNNTGAPLLEQVLELTADIQGANGEGIVQSTRIGPSQRWLTFTQTIDVLNNEDDFFTNIYGVTNGQRTVIAENVS
ncbi:MAG: hypothetical protein AAFO69_20945, partial [Bacteroidota bacterium]